MMRLPRFLPSVVLACCSVSLPLFGPLVARAQEPAIAPTTAAPDASGQMEETSATSQTATTKSVAAPQASLYSATDDFWHYAKIARYDLAKVELTKVLAKKDQPVAVLEALEKVAADRKDNLDQWISRWQQVPDLREPMAQLNTIMTDGYRTRRADPNFIEASITRLAGTDQQFIFAMSRLSDSGELAVTPMLDYLRNPDKAQYHAGIRKALVQLGKPALNPLIAALEMPATDANRNTLLTVISVLGEIGYDVSVPPLADLAARKDVPTAVRDAARKSLLQMGAGDAASLNAANLYYEVAQKYYYKKAAVAADIRNPMAFVWSWDDAKGLVKKDVPAAIFGDILTMRASRRVLELDRNRDDAMSLWLAANYAREVHLPAGAVDPTRTKDTPAAHYYGVATGAKYLNNVLARAMGDRDNALALRAIKSLQQIGGQSNLIAGGESQALVAAMRYPDRVLRFEAAFAMAAALPQSNFDGQDRVVPILAEAVAQNGKANVLVVMSDDKLNGAVQMMKDAGYGAAGAATPPAAVEVAAGLPAVDVILISDTNAQAADQMRQLAAATPRLQGAALLVMTATDASPFTVLAVTNPMVSTTRGTTAETLKPALEAARKKAGALPLVEAIASEYALKAAGLLEKLAISRGQVLDMSAAELTLLGSLDDSRLDLAKAAGNVLALMNSKPAQAGLLIKAADDKSDEQLKISLYKSLATSARFFGNGLDAPAIETLQKAVESEKSLEVRSAAAEARGALNLPVDQAKTLILGARK